MNRLARPLALLVPVLALSAFAVAGCTYVRPPVVTVAQNGKEEPFFSMSQDELDEKLAGATDSSAVTTTTKDLGYVSATAVADLLTQTVQEEILKKIVADRKLEPTEQDTLQAQKASQSQSQPTDTQAQLSALDRSLAESGFATGTVNRDESVQQFFDANKESYATPAQLCLHAIAVTAGSGQTQPTAEETEAARVKAADARRRLDSEPFETVAATPDLSSVSATQFPGGNVGCASEEQLGLPADIWAQLEGTPVGGLTDLIDLQGAFLIVRVDEKKPAAQPTLDQVRDQVLIDVTYAIGQQLRGAYLQSVANEFVVTVDPLYGTWDPQQLAVLPPPGAATPTTATTSTTAVEPLTTPSTTPETTPGTTPETTPGSVPPAAATP